jgi:hypothetical protein
MDFRVRQLANQHVILSEAKDPSGNVDSSLRAE